MNFSRKQNLVNFIQIKFSLILTNIYFGTYNLISKEISKKKISKMLVLKCILHSSGEENKKEQIDQYN